LNGVLVAQHAACADDLGATGAGEDLGIALAAGFVVEPMQAAPPGGDADVARAE
jgi:hypothetical protein